MDKRCDILDCESSGTVEGVYMTHDMRRGRQCDAHAYASRTGFMPRPYSLSRAGGVSSDRV